MHREAMFQGAGSFVHHHYQTCTATLQLDYQNWAIVQSATIEH